MCSCRLCAGDIAFHLPSARAHLPSPRLVPGAAAPAHLSRAVRGVPACPRSPAVVTGVGATDSTAGGSGRSGFGFRERLQGRQRPPRLPRTGLCRHPSHLCGLAVAVGKDDTDPGPDPRREEAVAEGWRGRCRARGLRRPDARGRALRPHDAGGACPAGPRRRGACPAAPGSRDVRCGTMMVRGAAPPNRCPEIGSVGTPTSCR